MTKRGIKETNCGDDVGYYYTPHYPDFVDLGYNFRRETVKGTQVRNSEDEDWQFAWDIFYDKSEK